MRLATPRCPLFCSLLLLLALAALPRTVHAQPGTIQSWQKINSISLGTLGIVLEDSDEFGDAVASLGDLDGPGPSVSALAVSAIGDDDGGNHLGAVYILFLNSSGTVLSYQKISATTGGFSGTLEQYDELGSSVTSLGDIDGAGPGVGAIAVGAIGDDDGGEDHGTIYVMRLNALGQAISTEKINSIAVGIPADINGDLAEFGGAVAGLGDLDGAGPAAAAVAVGSIGDNDGGINRGAVFIVYLTSTGTYLSSQKISDTAGNFSATLINNDCFGEDIANLGDIDGAGGGVRSIAVTAVDDNDGGTDSGAVYLLHLNSNGTVNSWSKISRLFNWPGCPVVSYDNFGAGVTGLGDLDGTGPANYALAVTAGSDDGAGLNRGAIYILFLNSAGAVISHQEISSMAGGTISAAIDDGDEFGSAMTALGDIDGSGGAAQVLIAGVGFDDDGGNDRGTAYVIQLNGGTTGGDQAPVVFAPATASGPENAALTVNVTASDPDGQSITSLTATNLPSGATFTKNGSNTSGTLSWTPSYSQSGTYTVTFTASNALSASASTQITISNVDRAPAVTAPANASGNENAQLTVNVTASDPDGQSISSLTATNLPSGATFTKNGSNTSGTLTWTPSYTQSGSYNVTFTATNALSGSASTQITIANVDRAPAVTAPANSSGAENSPITVNVTAADADGQSITSLTATNLPSGATFTPNGSNTSGTLTWTPSYAQSGSYNVTFTATNALSGSANTQITVSNTDRAPVVTAPANASGSENTLLTVNVTAADPDGQAITSLTATNLPTGATFTPNGSNTSGTLSWTPSFSQSGNHTITFTATNALSGSSSTQVTIANEDRAPTVSAPANASGAENAPITVNVTASDPDGQAITSLTATNLPAGATFTPGGGNTSGTLSWTPAFDQSGNYTVTFTASNALSGSASTQITVSNQDRAPVVTAPPLVLGQEGALCSFQVTASDPDGQAITSLTATDLPTGATFTPSGDHTSGTFSWTPGFDQAGDFHVTFTASNSLSGSAGTDLTIGDSDRAPVVTAPANASGSESAPLAVNVTVSDPDGQAITSLEATDLPEGATFTPSGDHTSGTLEWTPGMSQAGIYTVTFTATNSLSGSSSTQITIGDLDRAPAVTAAASITVVEGEFLNLQVTASDPDGQAITTLQATDLPQGATFTPAEGNASGTLTWTPGLGQSGTYTVTFTATNGMSGSCGTQITVTAPSTGVGGPAGLALLRPVLSPMPLRSRSTLSFRTVESGPVEVDLLDLTGRRVKLLMSVGDAAAGVHQVAIDGRSDRGERLASGIYLYRIVSPRRTWTGRVIVTR